MQLILTILLGAVAAVWIIQSARAYWGMKRLPRLADAAPALTDPTPSVSILFAARDEAAKLPAALASLLSQDYQRYEVIAANDRSRDDTGKILEEASRAHARLKVVHVDTLPAGWLGKTHALARAYRQASGEWLIFTDADVRFAPDLVTRAMSLAHRDRLDHLTLMGLLELRGFWEKVATLYFGVGFAFGVETWRVPDPRSRRYMGVGYFQMVRRSAYEAVGTHRRLALEVVDDMKLGKLVKLAGFCCGVGIAEERIRLRWNEGLRETIRNVEKNFFAALGFRVARTVMSVGGLLALSVLPFLALLLTTGPAQLLAGIAAATAAGMHAWAAHHSRVSRWYGLTHPLGALVFCYMLLRSMVVTLWHGGVTWRDTFYPLDELRKGAV